VQWTLVTEESSLFFTMTPLSTNLTDLKNGHKIVVVWNSEHHSYDQEVMSSTLGRALLHNDLGQVVYGLVLPPASSISWYQRK